VRNAVPSSRVAAPTPSQFAQAAAEFERVRLVTPEDPNPALLAADCYLRLGEFSRVIEMLRPIHAGRPEDRAVLYLLAMASIRGGQPEEGSRLVDTLLREGGDAEAHFLLGSVAFMAKDYPAAVKELGHAASLNHSLPSLESLYGQALLFTGDPDGAAKALGARHSKFGLLSVAIYTCARSAIYCFASGIVRFESGFETASINYCKYAKTLSRQAERFLVKAKTNNIIQYLCQKDDVSDHCTPH
jgi:tetratricopeptide (TPR) repeat protein